MRYTVVQVRPRGAPRVAYGARDSARAHARRLLQLLGPRQKISSRQLHCAPDGSPPPWVCPPSKCYTLPSPPSPRRMATGRAPGLCCRGGAPPGPDRGDVTWQPRSGACAGRDARPPGAQAGERRRALQPGARAGTAWQTGIQARGSPALRHGTAAVARRCSPTLALGSDGPQNLGPLFPAAGGSLPACKSVCLPLANRNRLPPGNERSWGPESPAWVAALADIGRRAAASRMAFSVQPERAAASQQQV